jgi:hypothetical protein
MLQLATEQKSKKDGGNVVSEEGREIDLVAEVVREHRKLLLELAKY